MASTRSNTARSLVKLWKLDVRHALYRQTGDWYHQLERFPGALLDENGYVIFETEEAYRSCQELRIRQDVSVPGGISAIPGYTLGSENSVDPTTTYERATYAEGARQDVVQTQIERSGAARNACIAAHGTACAACGFNFGAVYGAIGEGFIHVHHCNPVSLGVRDVDPISEMRPLCPNCHAMVHRENPPISITNLKQIIASKA
jgi:predicted HNH restriction endonuclease